MEKIIYKAKFNLIQTQLLSKGFYILALTKVNSKFLIPYSQF